MEMRSTLSGESESNQVGGEESYELHFPYVPQTLIVVAGTVLLKKSCVICINNFELRDKVRVLECGHAYHITCIDKWLHSKNNCPTCRCKVLISNNLPDDASASFNSPIGETSVDENDGNDHDGIQSNVSSSSSIFHRILFNSDEIPALNGTFWYRNITKKTAIVIFIAFVYLVITLYIVITNWDKFFKNK